MNKPTTLIPDLLKNNILYGPDSRSKFVLEEKKAKYIGLNENRKIGFALQIDNGLISDYNTKKCDKGLCIEDKTLYLIELKGVDFNTACKQLLITLDFFRKKMENYTIKCRAVVKEMPSKNNYPFSYKKLLASLPKSSDYFKSASGELIEKI
ncbi:MAG TPA: hypothetical protein DCZ76_07010 [Treponema sp.]|nr:hypothetical protein [Treponema sp.]